MPIRKLLSSVLSIGLIVRDHLSQELNIYSMIQNLLEEFTLQQILMIMMII